MLDVALAVGIAVGVAVTIAVPVTIPVAIAVPFPVRGLVGGGVIIFFVIDITTVGIVIGRRRVSAAAPGVLMPDLSPRYRLEEA